MSFDHFPIQPVDISSLTIRRIRRQPNQPRLIEVNNRLRPTNLSTFTAAEFSRSYPLRLTTAPQFLAYASLH